MRLTTYLHYLSSILALSFGYVGTKEYHIYPAIIDDEQYLFIDTASFGDPYRDNFQNFLNIVSCVRALGAFVQVAGVLFVLGGVGTRLS